MTLRSSAMTALEIAVRFLPHALALIVVTRTVAGIPYPFSPVGWLFLSVPILESLFGEERRSRHRLGRAQRVACRFAPWLWLPLQAAVLFAGMYIVRNLPDPVQAVWLAIPVGMLSGMFGMSAAHELMHRQGWIARSAAALLLISCGYGHFLIEHLRGHHRQLGTPSDAATARLGESVYAFLPRTVKGGLTNAWRLEVERLARQGRCAFDARNQLVALGALSLLLCTTVALVAGLAGLVFLIAQSVVSVAILEVVNYIQHYGLVRRETQLVPEPLTAAHAWDCRFRLTNLLLVDLGRHSDHHLWPIRRADELGFRPDAPRMPAGYFTMCILALLPPLWTLLIDPRAMLVRERLNRGLAALPAQSNQEGQFDETKD